jgi:hypothetical protein
MLWPVSPADHLTRRSFFVGYSERRYRLTPAGHKADDLFFFIQPDGDEPVDLLLDEVVLFDRGQP